MRINSDTSDGSSTRLTIGRATASNNFVNGSASGDSAITFGANLLFGVGTSEKLRISSTGQLSVNTTADVTGVSVAIGGSMRFVNATGQSATITALPSGTYNTGVLSLIHI